MSTATDTITITVPRKITRLLSALRREGYEPSAYIGSLLELDLQIRQEMGWKAGKGWPTGKKALRLLQRVGAVA